MGLFSRREPAAANLEWVRLPVLPRVEPLGDVASATLRARAGREVAGAGGGWQWGLGPLDYSRTWGGALPLPLQQFVGLAGTTPVPVDGRTATTPRDRQWAGAPESAADPAMTLFADRVRRR